MPLSVLADHYAKANVRFAIPPVAELMEANHLFKQRIRGDAMPFNAMALGMKVIHERAIRFAKRNVEACFAFASELANARDLQRRRYSVPPCTDTNAGLCAVQALCLGG